MGFEEQESDLSRSTSAEFHNETLKLAINNFT